MFVSRHEGSKWKWKRPKTLAKNTQWWGSCKGKRGPTWTVVSSAWVTPKQMVLLVLFATVVETVLLSRRPLLRFSGRGPASRRTISQGGSPSSPPLTRRLLHPLVRLKMLSFPVALNIFGVDATFVTIRFFWSEARSLLVAPRVLLFYLWGSPTVLSLTMLDSQSF